MNRPVLEPDQLDASTGSDGWMTVIFDNDDNTVDEVVDIIMQATGCDHEEAFIEMWEAHTYGKASVHFSGQSECEAVAEVIRSIGVRTEVTREWPE